jgi:hypothetical protein
MGIADQIKASLDTITNWKDWHTSFLGLAFKRATPADLEAFITSAYEANDWLCVAVGKRRAELIGYSSSAIDDMVKAFLDKTPFFTTAKVPQNPRDPGWFYPWYHVLINGYRWARELNYAVERWDPIDAFNKLRSLRLKETALFYRVNVDTGEVTRWAGGRWHQSSAWTGTWLQFERIGFLLRSGDLVSRAADSVLYEWDFLNSNYWLGDHYDYAPLSHNWEMRAPTVFFTYAKAAATWHMLPNFDRVREDTQNRCTKSLWLSPQWGGRKVIVHAYPGTIESRLEAELDFMGLLHMFYPYFDDDNKKKLRYMLLGTEGVTKMSDALLTSDLYDSASKRFRRLSDGSLDDGATIWGCASLFMQAITPDTGSIAVPLRAEGMEAYEHIWFTPTHFEFDYDARKIKIPVYAGKLTFTFGDKPVDYTFPYDGKYVLTFSSDWNRIINAQWVGELDDLYYKPPTPIPSLETQLACAMVAAAALTPATIYLIRALLKRR